MKLKEIYCSSEMLNYEAYMEEVKLSCANNLVCSAKSLDKVLPCCERQTNAWDVYRWKGKNNWCVYTVVSRDFTTKSDMSYLSVRDPCWYNCWFNTLPCLASTKRVRSEADELIDTTGDFSSLAVVISGERWLMLGARYSMYADTPEMAWLSPSDNKCR